MFYEIGCSMKLGVAQFTPVFKDVDANVTRIQDIIRTTDADIIVFPELATCGYFFHTAEEAGPYTLDFDDAPLVVIADTAQESGRVVVCGFAERGHTALYNSAMLVGPDIDATVYRKTHLFYRENNVFEPGNTGFPVVHLGHLGCNLGMMICYDWRFPESARTLALKGADVIAAPSNLITSVWRTAMPVRALENKVFLAVANRAGTETNNGESVTFNGDSVIYDYNGNVLASANAYTETDLNEHHDTVLIVEIDPSAARTKTINSFNDIIADRRPHLYE